MTKILRTPWLRRYPDDNDYSYYGEPWLCADALEDFFEIPPNCEVRLFVRMVNVDKNWGDDAWRFVVHPFKDRRMVTICGYTGWALTGFHFGVDSILEKLRLEGLYEAKLEIRDGT